MLYVWHFHKIWNNTSGFLEKLERYLHRHETHKKTPMDIFRKIVTLFALTIFIVYSIGISFSIHHCEHCGKNEVYILQHPDCCPSSSIEHHNACPIESQENLLANCCKNSHSNENIISHCNANCCKSELKYYKINLLYVYPNNQSDQAFDFLPVDNWINDILFTINFTSPINSEKDPPFKETPPLKQGGDLFLIFSHQQILYA